jgi:hypothetical protein
MADFDGKELYYFSQDAKLMTTPIVVRDVLQPGSPAVLFQTRAAGGGTENGQGRQYDVAPDGRFLINSDLDTVASPITLS